ncbi:MAG TPA: YcxB family protein [Tepidisphaeraceae bacterium]
MTPIQIEYQNTFEEWQVVYNFRARQSPASRLPTYACYAASAVGFLLLVVRPDGGGVIAPCLLIAFGLFLLIHRAWTHHQLLLKAWHDSEPRRGSLQCSISEMGIDIKTGAASYSLGWTYFTSYAVTPSLFLLLVCDSVSMYIPKSAFAPDELRTFRSLLKEKIQPPTAAFPVEPAR